MWIQPMMQSLATGETRLGLQWKCKERVWWQTGDLRVTLVPSLALPSPTCVNTDVQMCMYTNIHHHHGLHSRLTSDTAGGGYLFSFHTFTIYMQASSGSMYGCGAKRNILMESAFPNFSAQPAFHHNLHEALLKLQFAHMGRNTLELSKFFLCKRKKQHLQLLLQLSRAEKYSHLLRCKLDAATFCIWTLVHNSWQNVLLLFLITFMNFT